MPMTKICIVSHFAFGALSGGRSGHAGGVERQTSLMARWLAARGHEVSMLTWDEGQDGDTEIDGVRVIKLCRQHDGVPGLRFIHPRWTSLIRGMRRANADLYYHNCGEYVTGQIALWCRRNRKRFVYSVANDADCTPRLPEMKTLRERVLYRYGLLHADRVIVQTETQRKMLREGFSIDSVVLPMPCPGPSKDEYLSPPAPTNGRCRVAWVGRIHESKRLELLVEVARQLPDIDFDVAGVAPTPTAYSRAVLQEAGTQPNIRLHGFVARSDMPDFYRNASLLCCTSSYEGFPNTFLEAWSFGLPIVSTFDPDNLIATNKLGIVARDVSDIVAGIRRITDPPTAWREMSANARSYYMKYHTIDKALPRFEDLFTKVLTGASS